MDGKIGIVMKIAKQSDGEAFQPRRPAAQRDFLTHDSRKVRLNERRVGGKADYASGGCDPDKFSSGNTKKRQSVSEPYTVELERKIILALSITRIRAFPILGPPLRN